MDLLTSFKNYLFSQEVQPSKVTVKNYLSDINHFVNWFTKKYNSKFIPGQINAQTLSEYKKDNASILSASSMQRHLSSLRKFFKFLKAQEQITFDPFDSISMLQPEVKDYWKIKDFKSSLFDTNAAHLTIKNYIIDVKQFINWAKEATGLEDAILPGRITKEFVEEYKLALSSTKGFSPASVNRKLSSLRKYLSWAEQSGILTEKIADFTNLNEIKQKLYVPEAPEFSQPEIKAKSYSRFPPLRLAQKLSHGLLLGFDAALVLPLASSAKKAQDLIWTLRGKPIFHKNPQSFQIKNITHKDLLGIKNISKKVFAPSTIALSSLSPVQRLVFHARYTRPNWYKRYHSYAITHYFHFAVLIIFIVGLTLGFYNSFFGNQSKITAAPNLPTSPNRILSFQGRLTDSTDNPITSPSNLRFAIYTQQTPGTGAGILLWQEVDQVTPDTDGIFNTLLGSGPACANPISIATGQCAIPSTLFAQNAALFLGVTVESTAELTPRQQIATVAYAANSETLQGLLPITATAAGTTNVVLALDSSGNLTIGGSAAPSFSASGGQFKLSGQPLLLTTNDSSNSNVIISPNGIGKIDVQKPLQNNTLSTNIRSGSNGAFTAAGAVEVNDQFAVLATSSGQSAFTINQDSTGPVISASVSGLPVFTVDGDGNISNSGNYSVSGTGGITVSGTGAGITFSGTGNHDISASGGTLRLGALTLNGAITGANQNITSIGNISANSSSNTITGFGTIGTAATTNFTGQNLTVTGSVSANGSTGNSSQCLTGGTTATWGNCLTGTNWWTQLGGVIYPIDTGLDFAIGGNSTASADFAILNMNPFVNTFPLATIAGRLIVASDLNRNVPTPIATISGRTDTVLVSLNNNGSGDLLTASRGGNTKFTLDSRGNILLGAATARLSQTTPTISTGNTNATLTLNGDSTGNIQFFSSSNTIDSNGNMTLAGTTGLTFSSTGGLVLNGGTISDNTDEVDINDALAVSGVLQVNGTSATTYNRIGTSTTNHSLSSANDLFVTGNLEVDGTIFADAGLTVGSGQNLTLSGLTGNNQILYANTSGVVTSVATTSTAGQCLTSGTTTPVWSGCGGYWQLNQGALAPFSDKADLLIGSSATASAKFAFTGLSDLNNRTQASFSGQFIVMPNNGYGGNVGIGTTTPESQVDIIGAKQGTITTLGSENPGLILQQRLTNDVQGDFGPLVDFRTYNGTDTWSVAGIAAGAQANYTGFLSFFTQNGGTTDPAGRRSKGSSLVERLRIDTNGSIGLGTTSPISELHVTRPLSFGATGKSLAIFDQIENQDILTASASGTPVLTISRAGGIGLGGGAGSAPNYGNASQCLLGGTTVSWGACQSTTNWWKTTADGKALTPINSTMDLLVGGITTDSAKFAVVNVNSGDPAASVSGNIALQSPTGNNPATRLNVFNGGSFGIATSVGGNAGLTEKLSLSNAGYLGLNVTSPQAAIHINTSDYDFIRFEGGSYGDSAIQQFYNSASWSQNTYARNIGGSGFIYDTSNPASRINQADGTISLETAPTGTAGNAITWAVKAFINNTGNFGINTTTPKTTLDVRANSSTFPVASFSGSTINATLVVDNTGNGNLFTASASGSTRFVIDNNGSASQAGALLTLGNFGSANPVIQSTRNQSLTLGGGTTGDIQFKPGNSSSSLYLASNGNIGLGTLSPTSELHVTRPLSAGANGRALAIFDQIENQDILTASASGTPVLTISRAGGIGLGGGVGSSPNYGSASQCLTGGTTVSWGSCGSGVNWWNQLNGVVSPTTTNWDFALGGNSTSSALFAVLNMNPAVNTFPQATIAGRLNISDDLRRTTFGPIATISGRTEQVALYINNNGNGDLITASRGGNTKFVVDGRGNIVLGNPTARLTQTTPTISTGNTNATLTLNGDSTGNIQFFSSSNNLTSAGALTLASTITANVTNTINGLSISSGSLSGITGYSQTSGTFTMNGSGAVSLGTGTNTVSIGNTTGSLTLAGSGITANTNSVLYSGSSSVIGAATTSTTGLCLTSAANTPGWANCNAFSFWSQLNGVIFPSINTNDLVLGGNSTASAKFAVLNMDPKINTFPIATIAGRLWVGDDLRRVVAGPIATISGRTSAAALVVNNSGNGDLISASSSGFSRLVVNNSGKIGINNPLPGAYVSIKALGVSSATMINGYDTNTGTNQAFTLNSDSNGNGSLDLYISGSKKVHLVAWGGDNSYITDSNFGLGTTTPTAKLDVAGSASLSGNLAFYGSATNLNQYILNNSKLNFTVSPGGTDGVGDIGDGFSTSNQGQLPQALQLTYHAATSGVVNGTTYIYTLGGENTSSTALSTVYKSRIDAYGNAGAFSSTANALPATRWGGGTATVTIGSSTYIYYIGGSSGAAATSTAYVATLSNSDGSPGTFATTSPILGTRLEPAVTTATIGGTTYIYALGGFNSSSVNTSQTSTVYVATVNTNGTLGTFATTSALPASRGGGGARTTTIGGTTYIYYVGGGDTQGRSTVYKASINTNGTLNAFSSVTGLPLNRQEGGTELITVNGTSYIYSIGSGDNSSSTYSAAVYKTALDSSGNPGTWSSTGQSQLPLAFAYVGTTSISSGGTNYIFVLGGNVSGATGNSTVYRAGVFRPAATIANNGYVGIGMTNPAAKLQVEGTTDLSLSAAGSFVIGDLGGPNLGFDSNEIQARSNGATGTLYLQHAGGDVVIDGGGLLQVKDSTLRINNTGATTWNIAQNGNCTSGTTKLCFSAGTTAEFAFGTNGGLIMGGTLTQNNTPDIAENINVLDTSIEAGDIVSSVIYDSTQESIYDKAVASKANKPYATNIIGAISETPGIVLNAQLSEGLGETNNSKARPLTIAGRVPIKVSTINGKVKAGDPITSSVIPGMGMKATKAGNILGTVLTDYKDELATQSAVFINDEWQTVNRECAIDEPDCYAYEKVLVLINMSYYDPTTELAGIEDLVLQDQTPNANFTIPHYYQLTDILGKPIEKIGAFAELCVGYLRVGFIDAQQISTKSLNIATANVSIAGQSLHDYVAAIVSEQLSTVNNLISNNIVSPIAQIDQLNTNVISPVGQSKKIAIKLNDNQGESKLEIQNASGSALASFDSLGNATISGNLSSNNLLVNDNATVSGVLRASKIIADEIEGLNIKTSTIAANYITNNYYVATPGAFPTLPAENSNNYSGLIAGNYLNIASYSSQLANITNLTGDNAIFNNNLTVFGQTTLTDTSIVGQLAVGGNLIIADESINVLGGDLNLQPLRQGGLSIMAGLIHIDTNGNATFESDATIKGTLFANQIAPLPGKDLNIKLASDSAEVNKLVVKGASGAGVLAINNLGDLIASGEASFAKLNINSIVGTAYALSPTEVVASGSAGTVTLKAFKTEVTVNNKLVTPNSLIYITPLGSTANENLYLMRQTPGKSFTVGISNPISQDVKFNFLIVN